jgi:hypothetical protein
MQAFLAETRGQLQAQGVNSVQKRIYRRVFARGERSIRFSGAETAKIPSSRLLHFAAKCSASSPGPPRKYKRIGPVALLARMGKHCFLLIWTYSIVLIKRQRR